MNKYKNVALIFAGGTGTRMKNDSIPKQFIEVNGKPIIIHTLLCFEKHDRIEAIAVVCIDEWQEYLKKQIEEEGITKVKWIVHGGPTGQQSIYNGVKAIYDDVHDSSKTIVLISDGVRPLVTYGIITKNIECVIKNGTSATSSYVTETIIEVDDVGKVIDIPNRKYCMSSKAPQGFFLNQLMEAHQKAIEENKFDCTNSIELMSYYGHTIYVVEDSSDNIKITTPMDLHLLKALLNKNENDLIHNTII